MPTEGRHANWGSLPGKEELERLFVEDGLSYSDIGRRFGLTNGKSVYNTMKRRAQQAGTKWPLERGNSMTVDSVRVPLARHRKDFPNDSLRTIAAKADLSPVALSEIERGKWQSVSVETRDKLLEALRALRQGHSLAARHAKKAKAREDRATVKTDLVRMEIAECLRVFDLTLEELLGRSTVDVEQVAAIVAGEPRAPREVVQKVMAAIEYVEKQHGVEYGD